VGHIFAAPGERLCYIYEPVTRANIHQIRSLKNALAATNGHDIVGFVDNDMKGGEVASVIESLSKTITDAGKTPKIFENGRELGKACANDNKGVSKCFAAVQFLSSPDEGSSVSPKGVWNW
jgi:ATP-binding cassette subfamily A (ABC1) protein 3